LERFVTTAVVVRRMSLLDAHGVTAIVKQCPESALWSEDGLRESLFACPAWVAEVTTGEPATSEPPRTERATAELSGTVASARVVGFLVGRTVADEFEILNMAVSPRHRRSGIAGALMREALTWSSTAGVRRAYLEVRASNHAAISLYRANGFRECGRRAGYYASPIEDAVLFSADVSVITPEN